MDRGCIDDEWRTKEGWTEERLRLNGG
jgi:hypothetical protein